MNKKNFIILSVLFTLIDYIYLSVMSKHFKKLVNKIQGSEMKFRMYPAIFCYIFLVCGLYYFIISQNKNHFDAAILGWVIYGVYETTNAAIFKDWDMKSVIIDTIWGGVLFGSTTYIYQNTLGLSNV